MLDNHVLTPDQIRERYTIKAKGGAEYLKALGRVLLFRADNPCGQLITEALDINDTRAIFKATVYDNSGTLLATGHALVKAADAGQAGGRYVEKAETGALARALSNAGYGTDELADDDGPEMLADSPVKSVASAPAATPVASEPVPDDAIKAANIADWQKRLEARGLSMKHVGKLYDVGGLKELTEQNKTDWLDLKSIAKLDNEIDELVEIEKIANEKLLKKAGLDDQSLGIGITDPEKEIAAAKNKAEAKKYAISAGKELHNALGVSLAHSLSDFGDWSDPATLAKAKAKIDAYASPFKPSAKDIPGLTAANPAKTAEERKVVIEALFPPGDTSTVVKTAAYDLD